MTIVRYTNQLKSDLLESVVKDQFQDLFKQAEQNLKGALTEELNEVMGDFDKEISAKIAEMGLKPECYLQMVNNVVFAEVGDHYLTQFGVENPFNKNKQHWRFECFIQMNSGFTLKRSLAKNSEAEYEDFFKSGQNSFRLDEKIAGERGLLKSLKAYKAIKHLSEDAVKLTGQLHAVLSSVKSVKKLQEITQVFNPFIPSSVSTALLPTEALLAINELESPKTKKAA